VAPPFELPAFDSAAPERIFTVITGAVLSIVKVRAVVRLYPSFAVTAYLPSEENVLLEGHEMLLPFNVMNLLVRAESYTEAESVLQLMKLIH
jgi:hypothetical protein